MTFCIVEQPPYGIRTVANTSGRELTPLPITAPRHMQGRCPNHSCRLMGGSSNKWTRAGPCQSIRYKQKRSDLYAERDLYLGDSIGVRFCRSGSGRSVLQSEDIFLR